MNKNIFKKNFVIVFLIYIFNAADFWIVKNITGRNLA
jgi:hypothetical protein